jgi:ubiquinone/menaquinone biosynthesis C-methylase UbiE
MGSSMMETLDAINAKTRRAYNLAAQKYHDLFRNEMNEKEYDRTLLDKFAERFSEGAIICDAGCGPSGHIGRYVYEKGIEVIGIDIADKCIVLAQKYNPKMRFELGDISQLHFGDEVFDGIISYYSIIDTPKRYITVVFDEFRRVLKKGGYLLVAVKAGTDEGYVNELLGIETEIYFSLFTEAEILSYFEQGGFEVEYLDKRNPYDFEIENTRIFAIGRKV